MVTMNVTGRAAMSSAATNSNAISALAIAVGSSGPEDRYAEQDRPGDRYNCGRDARRENCKSRSEADASQS